MALKWKIICTPMWLRKLLRPLINLWSPITAGGLSAEESGKFTWQLWKMKDRRLQLVEEMLQQWKDA